MVKDTRQGWAVLAAMTIVFVALLALCAWAESRGNPVLAAPRRRPDARARRSRAATWKARKSASASPTRRCGRPRRPSASNGSVNSMHDSFTPLGGLVPMWLIQLGEVIYGGVGSGLYGMLVFAIIAVFVAGLMIGRTPEYLGKKIEAFEMKMAAIAILMPPFVVLDGHGDRRRCARRARRVSPIPARTASRRSSTRSRRRATTTAARSRASTPTRRSTTRRWALRCGSRATG